MNVKDIRLLADQCVRCGLCLPHCPTYQIGKEEPESPRGRIAMLAAAAAKELDWQPSLQKHVDQCLACGHCERVCPAQVQYDELLIKGRELLVSEHPAKWQKKLAIKIIETSQLRNLVFFGVRFLQKLKLWRVACWIANRCSVKLGRAMSFVPNFHPLPVPLPQVGEGTLQQDLSVSSCKSFSNSLVRPLAHTVGEGQGEKEKVLLFPGCTGENFGNATFAAAKNLLTQLGYDVILPRESLCCGTLRAHAGLGETTREITQQTLNDFCEKNKIGSIISFATGCKQNYMIDIQQFLLDNWPESLDIYPLPVPLPQAGEGTLQQDSLAHSYKSCRQVSSNSLAPPLAHVVGEGQGEGHFEKSSPLRVAVHSPCTQTNTLRNSNLSYDLLSKIPNLKLIRFGEKSCCGAAGSYMLEHETISEKLVEQLLTPELLQNCDVIVTSNIGCQLQFQRYLKKHNVELAVCHPIELMITS